MPTVPSSLSPRASSPLASSSRSPSRSPRCSPSSPSAKQREPWQARRDDANILQGLRLSGGPIEVARQVRAALAKPTALVRVIDLLRQMDDNNSGRIERAEWYKASSTRIHALRRCASLVSVALARKPTLFSIHSIQITMGPYNTRNSGGFCAEMGPQPVAGWHLLPDLIGRTRRSIWQCLKLRTQRGM